MTLNKTFFLLLGILLTMALNSVDAYPNKYEIKVIKEKIETSFSNLFQMWKEELYFEMYDHGQKKSRTIIAKPEFAQRMVELKWKPTLKPIKIENIDIIYRNFAAIKCLIEFENKINRTQIVVKEIIFPAILEDINWKFDLIQLIRSPFIGKYYEPPPPKPKEPKKVEPANPVEQAPAEE